MRSVFEPRLRAASIVKRWSIVWRTREDNIAEHSWYVTVYSTLVAQVIGWQGPAAAMLARAALHELEELVTGDVVSPVKCRLIDRDRLEQFVHTELSRSLPFAHALNTSIADSVSPTVLAEIDAIIKVADTLDALFFLLTEEQLGNRMVANRIVDSELALQRAWTKLPCSADRLRDLYAKHIAPAITEHRTSTNHDIGTYETAAIDGEHSEAIPLAPEAREVRQQAVGRPSGSAKKVRRKAKVGALPGAGAGKD